MTNAEKVIKNKMGLIILAEQLGNVSQACRIIGYSCDSFSRFKELYDEQGAEGLRELSRRKPNPKNRVDPVIEAAVLAIALENPALGQLRVSNTLKHDGIFVSPGGVRSIGIGRIYQQTFIDTYTKIGFATPSRCPAGKLHTSKHAITAADLLNDRVLPWYEEHSVRLLRILTEARNTMARSKTTSISSTWPFKILITAKPKRTIHKPMASVNAFIEPSKKNFMTLPSARKSIPRWMNFRQTSTSGWRITMENAAQWQIL